MADSQGLSKAAKKNKKKQQKKTAGAHGLVSAAEEQRQAELQQILQKLQHELALAKEVKDMPRIGKIREQIWVMNDIIAGIRTDMPEEEIREIIQDIPIPETKPTEVPVATAGALSEPERRVRTLKKKLGQIEKIREKKAKGEALEKNQVEKLESEQSVRDELEELEELMAKALAELSIR